MEINVQDILDRHEAYKLKGLQLTNDDLFNWLCLQDEIITHVCNMRSTYTEKKLKLDKDKALRGMELKLEKDGNGKTVNTDSFIEKKIKNEFYLQDLELATLKATSDLLY